MPLWKIYHPSEAFTEEDKHALAQRITKIYAPFMPKFYVGIVFEAALPNTIFIGGEPHNKFVRIWIDHIAREFPDEASSVRFINKVNEVLAPFIRDRGYDWEFHVDETPVALWSVQGFFPPRAGTDDEKRWIAENRASPRTHA